MTQDEAGEAHLVLLTVLNALSGVLPGSSDAASGKLFYGIGDMAANGPDLIQNGGLGTALASVFDLATAAGPSLIDMEAVRVTALSLRPRYRFGGYLAVYAAQFALAQEVKIVAATTFASSQAAQAALTFINNAFEYSAEFAADNAMPDSFQALIAAQAAAVQDLSARAIRLPKLVAYATVRPLTAHALAYRLYGDAGRADELRAENAVVHPAFMPVTGTALSE